MTDYNIQFVLQALDQATTTLQGARQELGQIGDEQGKIKEKAGQAAEGSDRFGRTLQNLQLAAAATALFHVGQQFVELGRQANSAENTFDQLSDSMNMPANTMQLLRDRTRGVVDDMALMQGANQLMSMGLASTQDEMVDLIGMAVDLGGAMGSDAATSVADFAAMLANQSIPRLDTFGISSGRVRERIDELMASGQALNREEAFRMAVLEEGAASIDRLGTSAEANADEIAQLGTTAQNVMQDVGQAASDVTNQAAGTLNLAIDTLNAMQQLDQMQVGAGSAVAAQLRDSVLAQFGQQMDPVWLENIIRDAMIAIERNPALANDAQGVINAMFGYGVSADIGMQDSDAVITAAVEYAVQQRGAALEALANSEQRLALEQQMLEVQRQQAAVVGQLYSDELQTNQALESRNAMLDSMTMGSQTTLDNMREMFDAPRGELDGVTLFSEDEATRLEGMADSMDTLVERAQAMHDQGMITDDQLENLQTAADEARDLAEQARAGADAFKDMSLTDLFGQTTDGAMQDATDQIIDAAKDRGMSEEEIAALQEALDLQSGAETTASVAFRDQVIPQILALSQETSAEAAALAVEEYLAQQADLRLQGATPDQMAGASGGFDFAAAGAGEAQAVDMELLTTQYDDIATDTTTISTDMTAIAEQTLSTSEQMNFTVDHSEELRDNMKLVRDYVAEITSGIQLVRLRITVDDPQQFLSIVSGAQSAGLARVVRDNGGAVPGVDGRNR